MARSALGNIRAVGVPALVRLPRLGVAVVLLASGLSMGQGHAQEAGTEEAPVPPLRPPELDGSEMESSDLLPRPSPPKESVEPTPGPAPEVPAAALPEPAPQPSPPKEIPDAVPEPAPQPSPPRDSRGEVEPTEEAEPEAPAEQGREESDERPTFDMAVTQECEFELRTVGAAFELRGAIEDSDGCGAERPLALLSLPEAVQVLGSDVTLRCDVALLLAKWVQQVVVPSAVLHLGTPADGLMVSTTYQCRDRRGGGPQSQHAFANAVDVMGVTFADGSKMLVQERPGSAEPVRAFQAAIRGGACAYFTTVLGPATDESHGDHLHLDLKERRNGYRICQ